MARDWPQLPVFQSEEDAAEAAPEGWTVRQIEDVFEKLDIGKRFDQKACSGNGRVPVVDQSADGFVGFHDEEPGVSASKEKPVITFANHTCEMRVMRRPFSVIQNVFPMVGKRAVSETLFFYYATKGRVHLEEYKGHYPDFRRLWIPLPPLAEQKAIAAVLGALDDKIEVNRRMNATLEAMARALFQRWFVDFDPVRAKLDPAPAGPTLDPATAALFPDTFQDSTAGHIPSGWRVMKVSEFIERLSVGQKYEQKTVSPVGKVPVLDQGKSGVIGFHNNEPGVTATLDKPVAVFANHTCYMRLITYSFSAIQNVLPFVGSVVDTFWAYYATEGRLSFSEYKGHWPDFVIQESVVPPRELTDAFGRLAKPLVAQVRNNEEESRTLATLRDTLLPKLLSGELSVVAASATMEASA